MSLHGLNPFKIARIVVYLIKGGRLMQIFQQASKLSQQKQQKIKDPNKLGPSEKRVFQIVQCNNGVTGVDVSKKN